MASFNKVILMGRLVAAPRAQDYARRLAGNVVRPRG